MEEAAHRLAQPAFFYNQRLQAQGGILYYKQDLNTQSLIKNIPTGLPTSQFGRRDSSTEALSSFPGGFSLCPIDQKLYSTLALCQKALERQSSSVSHPAFKIAVSEGDSSVSQLLLRRTSKKQGGVSRPMETKSKLPKLEHGRSLR